MDLSIIIVNYYSERYISDCFKSIDKYTQDITYEKIIVNNSEKSKALDDLVEKGKNIRLLQNECNIGFGRAVNRGVNVATGKYLLILNPDTKIFRNILQELCTIFDKSNDIHLATIRISLMNDKEKYQLSFSKKYSICRILLSQFFNIKGKYKSGYFFINVDRPQKVDVISGAFMFIRSQVFKDLGGFDERIFLYSEDTELSIRAQKHKFNAYYLPLDGVMHVSMGSSSSKYTVFSLTLKNQFYVLDKHYNFLHRVIIKSLIIMAIFLRTIVLFILSKIIGVDKVKSLFKIYKELSKNIILNKNFG